MLPWQWHPGPSERRAARPGGEIAARRARARERASAPEAGTSYYSYAARYGTEIYYGIVVDLPDS
jgi:hypothetical protein